MKGCLWRTRTDRQIDKVKEKVACKRSSFLLTSWSNIELPSSISLPFSSLSLSLSLSLSFYFSSFHFSFQLSYFLIWSIFICFSWTMFILYVLLFHFYAHLFWFHLLTSTLESLLFFSTKTDISAYHILFHFFHFLFLSPNVLFLSLSL